MEKKKKKGKRKLKSEEKQLLNVKESKRGEWIAYLTVAMT